jgi:hypothetical protein
VPLTARGAAAVLLFARFIVKILKLSGFLLFFMPQPLSLSEMIPSENR